MAYLENQFRVCVEFIKTSGRAIELNHHPAQIPIQLQGRIAPEVWSAFFSEVERLSFSHPYVVKPSGGQYCEWFLCSIIGSVIGFCCVNPDGGDYSQWSADCMSVADRFAPDFNKAGCTLSFQRRRDIWFQIDIDPNIAPGIPTTLNK